MQFFPTLALATISSKLAQSHLKESPIHHPRNYEKPNDCFQKTKPRNWISFFYSYTSNCNSPSKLEPELINQINKLLRERVCVCVTHKSKYKKIKLTTKE